MKIHIISIFFLFFQNSKIFASNIAVVDMQSVISHSTAMIAFMHEVSKIDTNNQKEFSIKEAALKIAQENLISKRNSMSDKEFYSALGTFNKSVSELQVLYKKSREKVSASRASAKNIVVKNIEVILHDISQNKSIELILDSSANDLILYKEDSYDITKDVIKELNHRLPKIEMSILP